MKNVLAIAGSLRQLSYNRLLLRAAVESAPPGMGLLLYDGLGSVPLFDADLEASTGGGPAPVRDLRQKVASAQALLIATPEYNHSLPGVLKNAIDWLSRQTPEGVLIGKPVAVIGASGGPSGTRLAQAALRQVLYATESLILPSPSLFARDASRLFDESGRLVDRPTRDRLQSILVALDRFIDGAASLSDRRPAPG